MAQVLVRELPDDTVKRLKERAKAHRRTLQAELREILERAAGRPPGDWKKRLEELDRMFGNHIFSPSTRVELREILERAGGRPPGDWKKGLEELDRLFEDRTISDSTALIREDRESH